MLSETAVAALPAPARRRRGRRTVRRTTCSVLSFVTPRGHLPTGKPTTSAMTSTLACTKAQRLKRHEASAQPRRARRLRRRITRSTSCSWLESPTKSRSASEATSLDFRNPHLRCRAEPRPGANFARYSTVGGPPTPMRGSRSRSGCRDQPHRRSDRQPSPVVRGREDGQHLGACGGARWASKWPTPRIARP